ncbi:MAG TPA: MlaD family protein [Solirubrobacteraceae bacterium]|nr:MlaD family protein [Solirubrobacteraceae bacterium]
MRRLVGISLVSILVAVGVLVAGTVAQGSDSYSFDVIFDNARGLISGQQVKIAGAVAGTISNVVVTPQDQARVEATVTGPFRFHTDATCIIRPDGLIAENYLDCDPGTPSAPLLQGQGNLPPTVPVSHTSEPVNLQDLFNIFNLPTRERLQVLINELGIATAGNGEQINAILQRANPTLGAAQRVIRILDAQTSQIATAIQATDAIARQGAGHISAVQHFIVQASGLTQLTAGHAGSLEQGINKLPAFLAAATPALTQLNAVATDGTPLLANLRAAAPSLNRVDADILPFTKVANPALTSLSRAFSQVIPDARSFRPLVDTLGNYLHASGPSTASFAKLLVNLIHHGFSENFLSVLYYVSTALSKYDANSHMLSALLTFPGNGACANYATTPSTNPDCNAHYGTRAAYVPARRHAVRTPARHRAASTTPGRSGATPRPGSTSLSGGLSNGLKDLGSTVSGGLSSVTSSLGSTLTKVTSGLGVGGRAGTTTSVSHTTTSSSLQNLLNYLLK